MRYLWVIFAVYLVSACSSLSGTPHRSEDLQAELAGLKPYFAADVLSQYNQKTGDEKLSYRNEVVMARLRAVDLYYYMFINELSEDHKNLNIGTDTSVMLLGAMGAVSTVSGTQAIYSSAAALVTGAKASVDKNVFYESTLQALVGQMNANRKQVQAQIYTGLSANVSDYPLLNALIDIEAYFQAGTLLGAIAKINEAAGQQKGAAEAEIANTLQGKFFKTAATDILKSFITDKAANRQRLADWLKQRKLTVSVTSFLHMKEFAELRAQAAAELVTE